MSLDGASLSPEPSRPRGAADARLPLVVFGLEEVIALPVLLELGRARWFFGDDWYFLAYATTGGFKTALAPNSWGHWLTLPILTYRLLWWLFGLRHFKAYLLLLIVLHLVTAALLRAVMRRCGAGPWISTVAASILVFFGPGWSNIFVPVEISFLGSLVFGLTHLLLADHEGKIDYRDFVGLACGLAGLMCSNVAIAMVATVGIAALWRRGWRAALLHTVPLASIYLAWWFTYARSANRLLAKRASVGELVPFLWKGWRASFVGFGHSPRVGLVLAVIFVAGLVVAWTQVTDVARHRSAAAAALAVGAVIFVASVGLVRASPALTPAHFGGYASRYVYVSAAMILPALAVATTALARRWRRLAPIAIVALLVGVPGNYHQLATYGARFPKRFPHDFLVLAHSPAARRLPPRMRVPIGPWVGYMTAGWLVAGAKSGRIPRPGPVTAKEAATAALALKLSPYPVAARLGPGRCRLVQTKTFVLQTGDQLIATSGTFKLVYVTDRGATSAPLGVVAPRRFQVFGPLRLRVIDASVHPPATLKRCTPQHGTQ